MDQRHSDTDVDPRFVGIFRDVLQRPGLQLRRDTTPGAIPGRAALRRPTLPAVAQPAVAQPTVAQPGGLSLRAAPIRRIGSVANRGRLIQNRQD